MLIAVLCGVALLFFGIACFLFAMLKIASEERDAYQTPLKPPPVEWDYIRGYGWREDLSEEEIEEKWPKL